MSRVHQALQRAGGTFDTGTAHAFEAPLDDFLNQVPTVPDQLSPDALMLDPLNPAAAPSEEFRALRTRLNHMQSRQPIRTRRHH